MTWASKTRKWDLIGHFKTKRIAQHYFSEIQYGKPLGYKWKAKITKTNDGYDVFRKRLPKPRTKRKK